MYCNLAEFIFFFLFICLRMFQVFFYLLLHLGFGFKFKVLLSTWVTEEFTCFRLLGNFGN